MVEWKAVVAVAKEDETGRIESGPESVGPGAAMKGMKETGEN